MKFEKFLKEVLKRIFNLPGIPEIYVWIYNQFKRPKLYDCCWWHINHWLEELKEFENKSDNNPPIRILVFSTLPYWINYMMALSVVLLGRQINIDFAWILYPKIYKNNSILGYKHWLAQYNAKRNLINHPHLRIFNLDEVKPSYITDEMQQIAHQQALIDVSYLLKKENIHVDTNPLDKETYQLRYNQNLNSISHIATLISQSKYDRVILPNGVSLDFGAVYRYLNSIKIPVSSIEMWDINGKVIVSNDLPVVRITTEGLWIKDEPHILSDSKRIRVQKNIKTRQNPINKDLNTLYQHAECESSDSVRSQLNLKNHKPVVLICPNVPYDSIFYVERKKYFDTMSEWFKETVTYLSHRDDCQVIIRSHPAEDFHEASETISSIMHEIFPVLPDHFRLVPPKASINTYSIMQIADMGIVYASTTGLEMAMRGIPVICGISNQHYNRKGFTIDPETQEEYFNFIDMVIKKPECHHLNERAVELSWCYADIYFNQWSLRFPWHVDTLLRDLKKWPICRMLSLEGSEQFGSVFDILSDSRKA